MKRQGKKLFVGILSLAVLSCAPVLANGVEEAGSNNTAIGSASVNVRGSDNTAYSSGAEVLGGSENVAIGSAKVTIRGNDNEATAIGALVIGGTGNLAMGTDYQTINGDGQSSGDRYGYGAKTGYGDYNTSVGSNSFSGGYSESAPSNYNTAIGHKAIAVGGNSVALGAGSIASQADTVSVGRSADDEGGQYNRRITNVAPGYYGTDAVNINQLRNVDSKVDRVGASAAAFSALAPLAYDPKEPTQYAAGIGTYNGTGAFAVGVYHYTKPDIMLNAAISISNDGWEKHARVGISWRTGGAKAKEIAPAVEPKESIEDRVKRILEENKTE